MTSSDAPQPPGGPLRRDAADGDFADDVDTQDLVATDVPHGTDDSSDVPPVSHEPEQSEPAAELQEENAGTTLDQPSQ